jgi:putative intracellular protease/amidase
MSSGNHRRRDFLATAEGRVGSPIGIAGRQCREKNDGMKTLLLLPLVLVGLIWANVARAAEQKPVLMVLTSHGELGDTGKPTGFFLGELTHPLEVFEQAGIAVEFASVKGGEPPVDGMDLEDGVNARYWNDPGFRAKLAATKKLSEIDLSDYAGVYFAGGHGTMWDFPDDEAVQKTAREIYEAGAPVGAVCHGPAALVNVKLSDGSYLVDGKEVSAFTNDEEETVGLTEVVPFLLASKLEERGAKHQPAPNFEKQVVASGRLVTGQNPASAAGVAQKMVEILESKP